MAAVMGDVVPYRPPRERSDTTAFLGMVIFLGSWAMMFAALFFGYAVLRARSASWPPVGTPAFSLTVPALNTLALVASSALLHTGLWRIRRGKSHVSLVVSLAALLGAVFLGLQCSLWLALNAQGLKPSSGPFGSVFFGLTWFHALHVAVGVVGLARLAFHAWTGQLSPAKFLPLRLWSLYWHFVGVIWAAMFVTLFLM
jgi:cytochrome c oxidase subunit 3